MNPNIKTLLAVCERQSVDYTLYHTGQNIVQLETPNGPRFFVNWSTPFNDHTIVRLCEDKDYTQTLLSPLVQMPRTRSFLDPDVNPIYARYRSHFGLSALADQIEGEFAYPFIVKRNRGSHGTNVFSVDNRGELEHSLTKIFNKEDKDYDFVLLAQEKIAIQTEYRAVFFDDEHAFSYRKDLAGATFQGNLSPFRWGDAKAKLEEDPTRIEEICEFMQPAWPALPIPFVGADVALDTKGNFWLIEMNSAPSFNFFIRDCGVEKVEELYEKMLQKLGCIP